MSTRTSASLPTLVTVLIFGVMGVGFFITTVWLYGIVQRTTIVAIYIGCSCAVG